MPETTLPSPTVADKTAPPIETPQRGPRRPRRQLFTRDTWLRAIGTAGGTALVAWLCALVMPRGPVNTGQALLLLGAGLLAGVLAGFVLRSRAVFLLAPAAFIAGFELGRWGTPGLTVGGIHLDTFYGALIFLIGRGFTYLIALWPLLVGSVWGLALTRRYAEREGQSAGARAVGGTVARWTGPVLGQLTVAGLVVGLALPASTPPVTGPAGEPLPGSLAALETVRLGGHDQWILLRAANVDKPVLLYLAGGPGQSNLPIARVILDHLAQDFVVVTWDQRGTGKSYGAIDPAATFTFDRAVADTIELTNYLRERFDEDKIYLLGESYGTLLGVRAILQAPDLYHAYLGSGQMASIRETDQRLYQDVLDLAAESGDTDLTRRMLAYGEPPYADPLASALVMQQYDRLYQPYTPPQAYLELGARYAGETGPWGILGSEYNLVEKTNVLRGLADTFSLLYPQIQDVDLRRDAARLAVPVYVLDGQAELTARRDPALEWYADLEAPIKRIYSFEDSAHAPAFEHFEDLRRILVETIVPETYGTRG